MNTLNYTARELNSKIINHYENFPVARFLPKKSREAILILYAFARIGDDIADDGLLSKKQKMAQLSIMCNELNQIKSKKTPTTNFFKKLSIVADKHKLDIIYLENLLKAFKQDVVKNTYKNVDELMSYYKYAANSAGRLYLQVNGYRNKSLYKFSDNICEAFAMIDMIQDINDDGKINRVYLPQSLIREYQIDLNALKKLSFNDNWKNFRQFWVSQIKEKLAKGQPLSGHLNGRFSFEVKFMINSGFHLLNKLEKSPNPFKNTKMNNFDWIMVFIKALI
jgi:squalene synthase HpnC